MLEGMMPKGVRKPKHLHAKDIYHGTHDYHGDKWETVRMPLLDEMAKIPQNFDLPLFGSALDRAGAARELKLSDRFRDVNCYNIAASACILLVERYMREHTEAGEVAQLIF